MKTAQDGISRPNKFPEKKNSKETACKYFHIKRERERERGRGSKRKREGQGREKEGER